MEFRESSEQAAQYLREAVPLMVQKKIPTNPHNFALWYTYATKKNEALNQKLDEKFSAPDSYQHEVSEQLFLDFIVKSYFPDEQETQEAVMKLLGELFGSVQEAANGNQAFGQSLQRSMEKVKDAKDPKEIESVLQELLEDTTVASNLNQAFQDQLHSAQSEIETLKLKLQDSEQNALVDALTKIGNRRSFDEGLGDALTTGDGTTCLLLFDLDHFKKFNDTYGHQLGDHVLTAVGKVLNSFKRDNIHVARYGGEEFGIIVKRSALHDSINLAESIREKISKIRIKQKSGEVIEQITVSIGVARHESEESAESLIERVDQALYKAKEQGRNQVQQAA